MKNEQDVYFICDIKDRKPKIVAVVVAGKPYYIDQLEAQMLKEEEDLEAEWNAIPQEEKEQLEALYG